MPKKRRNKAPQNNDRNRRRATKALTPPQSLALDMKYAASILIGSSSALRAFNYVHPKTGARMSTASTLVLLYVSGWNDCAAFAAKHSLVPPRWDATAELIAQVDDGAGPEKIDQLAEWLEGEITQGEGLYLAALLDVEKKVEELLDAPVAVETPAEDAEENTEEKDSAK